MDRAGREYWYWPITGDPLVDPPQISIGGGAWVAMVEAEDYEPQTEVPGAVWYQALVAGPATEDEDPEGSVVVPRSGAAARIRRSATPEALIRPGGRFHLTR
jgi:hypothetical protein